ncbi:GNAT family N-acetyltransferase [Rhodoferax sp. OV413]|uniref:GNAT family N-acetyltransferase n=1 Tax=Rhodoferax sp. OV413 TaxID=1855285 RepID=UPI000B82C61E|nr:N-acetyltransferase [Rhodoferax sp. OV413]
MPIRPETPADTQAIFALTERAFAGHPHSSGTEPHIVSALRAADALTLSLVAELDGAIVGHVAISPVTISDGTADWYGLGPISVDPACQGRGLGSDLMRTSLERLAALGVAGCVVLGDPGYYTGFGFQVKPGLVYPGPPAEYFMALGFGASHPEGRVTYHAAFA